MTVEEAELAIARAGGGPAPASAPATANGVAAGAPYTALVRAPVRLTAVLVDPLG